MARANVADTLTPATIDAAHLLRLASIKVRNTLPPADSPRRLALGALTALEHAVRHLGAYGK